MKLNELLLLVQDEFANNESEIADAETNGGLLGDLSLNFRILTMVIAVVIIYLVIRALYTVLIEKEWYPSNARLLVLSIFFTLFCAGFTIIFLGQFPSIIIITFWVLLVILILFAWLKRRK